MNFSRKRTFLVAVAVCIGAAITIADRTESTPQEVFDGMRGSFQAAKAKGVHARYQWDLSGPNGGEWWIDVEDGTYKMGKWIILYPSGAFLALDTFSVGIRHARLSRRW